MDVSPRQMVSVATAMIPFLEHDDANRALMGSNMQRQSVPLLASEAPLVGTGMEYRAAIDAGDVIVAEKAGVVEEVSADYVTVMQRRRHADDLPGRQVPPLQPGHLLQPEADRRRGRPGRGRPGPRRRSLHRRAARWRSARTCSWRSCRGRATTTRTRSSCPSASCRTTSCPRSTSRSTRSTPVTPSSGPEEITRDIPNVSEEVLADLDERGIIRIGAEVVTGDILVGKVTPKGETELTPEERLLRAIFGEKAREVRDTSLKVPHGEQGKVIGVRVFSREDGDELPPRASTSWSASTWPRSARSPTVTSWPAVTATRASSPRSSRSRTCRSLRTARPVDIILNPLGVPGRMNVGQVLETHLGWIAARGWDISGIQEAWAERLRDKGFAEVEPHTNMATPPGCVRAGPPGPHAGLPYNSR